MAIERQSQLSLNFPIFLKGLKVYKLLLSEAFKRW